MSSRHHGPRPIDVGFITARESGGLQVAAGGGFVLPDDPSAPWLLPRAEAQVPLARRLAGMPWRLADLGYAVSTGPLVWNRHKGKLRDAREPGAVPLIWAECVAADGSGRFEFKAVTRGHKPWFLPGPGDEANIVRRACVLVQRTTALEQARRLIAAELPQPFINRHGGAVSVENHVNMVRPLPERKPAVAARTVARLLNSAAMDQAFRCINGTPAVSAYEIEATPLPAPQALAALEADLPGLEPAAAERRIWELYGL